MSGFADDDVVVDGDAEWLGHVDDLPCHLDVRIRRRRVARRVIVDQDDGRCPELQRTLDDLTRINRRMVDSPLLLKIVGNQPVLLVEEEDAELLDVFERHLRPAIVDQCRP